MSRIGKQHIAIPEKTQVTISDELISVKGPLGELTRTFKPLVKIEVKDGHVVLLPKREDIASRALWGTYASHLKNMIQGVNKAYEKKLIIEGVGYRAQVSGNELVLRVGFSHPVPIAIPEQIKVAVEKNLITITGSDKEAIGQFAAFVRAKKKPEPYKGKGIRYEGEVIRRKQGKKAA